MNDYELALQNIKDAIDMLHRHIYNGTFNHPHWSISKIQELINKDKKYAWHDLRNDPNDLPKPTEQVLLKVQIESGDYVYITASRLTRNDNGCPGFGYPIAWKEIEPFED